MKLIILTILILLSQAALSQAVKVTYRIDYKHIINSQKSSSEKAFLYIQPNGHTLYATQNQFKIDSLFYLVHTDVLSPYDMMNEKSPRTFFHEFIERRPDNPTELVVKAELATKQYQYTQTPEMNWQIDTATAVINGYQCQKATGAYAGRQYEAWYTPDIPLGAGPFKFGGLPGLILKMQDTEQLFTFTTMAVEKYTAPLPTIYRTNYTPLSWEHFQKMEKNYRENTLDALLESIGGKLLDISDSEIPPPFAKRYHFIEKL